MIANDDEARVDAVGVDCGDATRSLVFKSDKDITLICSFASTRQCDAVHRLFQEWSEIYYSNSATRARDNAVASMTRFLQMHLIPVARMHVFPGRIVRNCVNTSYSVIIMVDKSKLPPWRLKHPLIARARRVGIEVSVKRNTGHSLLVVCQMVCTLW
jgi:hypothetical protein